MDLDSNALDIPQTSKRCDYLFFGHDGQMSWVAPIELKSGAFRGGEVADQLQGGADIAERWIGRRTPFALVPILAYGKVVRKARLKTLRKRKIRLLGQVRQAVLVKCGTAIGPVLSAA